MSDARIDDLVTKGSISPDFAERWKASSLEGQAEMLREMQSKNTELERERDRKEEARRKEVDDFKKLREDARKARVEHQKKMAERYRRKEGAEEWDLVAPYFDI